STKRANPPIIPSVNLNLKGSPCPITGSGTKSGSLIFTDWTFRPYSPQEKTNQEGYKVNGFSVSIISIVGKMQPPSILGKTRIREEMRLCAPPYSGSFHQLPITLNSSTMKKGIIYIIGLVLLSSCEDVVEVDLPEVEPKLIVDGLVRVDKSEEFITIEIGLKESTDFFEE